MNGGDHQGNFTSQFGVGLSYEHGTCIIDRASWIHILCPSSSFRFSISQPCIRYSVCVVFSFLGFHLFSDDCCCFNWLLYPGQIVACIHLLNTRYPFPSVLKLPSSSAMVRGHLRETVSIRCN